MFCVCVLCRLPFIPLDALLLTKRFCALPRPPPAPLFVDKCSPTGGAAFTVSAVVSNTGTASGSVGKVAVWTSGYAGPVACGATTDAAVVLDLSRTTVAAGRTATVAVPKLAAPPAGAPATLGVFVDSGCAAGGAADAKQKALTYTPLAGPAPVLKIDSVSLTPAT